MLNICNVFIYKYINTKKLEKKIKAIEHIFSKK